MLPIDNLLNSFWTHIANENISIYNEFSFQHELGFYIRENTDDFNVEFERNIDFFKDRYVIDETPAKREIDIVIYNDDLTSCYAIELKYPQNKRFPATMYDCIRDIKFMEQLKIAGFKNTYCITLVNKKDENRSHLFYSGKTKDGIYKYFRDNHPIDGEIPKPTKPHKGEIRFPEIKNGPYYINWHDENKNWKKYIVKI